jgi:hypothetical protein
MKCYCYETETEFVFCVEDADAKLEDNLKAAWFKKTDKGFIKNYYKDRKHIKIENRIAFGYYSFSRDTQG